MTCPDASDVQRLGLKAKFIGRSLSDLILRLNGGLLLLLGLAGSVVAADAEAAPEKWSPQVWLNPGTYSYHFDRNKKFREDNLGLGAEVWLTKDHALLAGTFINSDGARSRYGAYQWRPLHWHPAGVRMSAGIAVGAFDGYPRYRSGGWFPSVLPVLAVEYKSVGVNFFIVPTISSRTDGAVAVQLKVRVW